MEVVGYSIASGEKKKGEREIKLRDNEDAARCKEQLKAHFI